jgi:hypothetical protein
MSVSSAINRIVYTCDGVTTAYAFPYYFFADSNLTVTKKLIASPYTETVLVLNTDYTVTDAGVPAGGHIDLTAAYAATYYLIIERIMPLTQTTDLEEGDAMPAETIEASLDKLVMICQQLQAEIDTSILINLPTLVPGYLYNDGTALSWSTITTTAYAGAINRGLDAAKAAVPSAGDIYIATDTSIMYICYTAGTWVANPNFSGLTAKGASLADNDLFMIEDSAALYVKKKVLRSELKTDITDNCVFKTGIQTINGLKTFGSTPLVPVAAPTLDAEVANKKYVDDVLNSVAGYDASSHAVDNAAESIVATVAINTIAGQNVMLNGNWRITRHATVDITIITLYLYRDAVLLYSTTTASEGIDTLANSVPFIPVNYLDAAAGTAATTYTLKAKSNSATPITINGQLSVVQVK